MSALWKPSCRDLAIFALGRGLAVSHAMESHHPKGIDYWYLHYAGVRPEHQGKGWGGAAIHEGVTRARSGGSAGLS
jgi:ribosomal protein S18 acetylase RimI-like enzyme